MANTVETDFKINFPQSELNKVDQYKVTVSDLEKTSSGLGNSAEKATDKIAKGFDKAKASVADFDKSAKAATPQVPTISRYWEAEAAKTDKAVADIKASTAQLSKRSGYQSVGFTVDDATGEAKNVKSSPPKPKYNVDYGESEFNTALKRIKDIGDESEKTAVKFGRLRGFGAIFRELNLGINETELNAGLAGAEIAGIGAATLATFGAAAVAGVAIVKVTEQIKSEAESRLRNEELITGAINKQVIGLRDAFAEYEKFKTSLINDKAFTKRLAADVGVYDAKAIEAERGKVEAGNKSRIEEINRLQAQLAQNERSLEFEKGRKVRENLFTELGFGNEYTASQKTQNVSQAERAAEKTKKSLAEAEKLLEKGKSALEQTDKALIDVTDKQNKNFSDNAESEIKSREQANKFENERREKAREKAKQELEKRNADIEKATNKAEELGKRYRETFDNLFVSTSKNNPFASVFAEGDRAIDKLRENLKGIAPELRAVAEQMQQKLNADSVFNTRLENDLAAYDLRQTAQELRNYGKDPNKPNEIRADLRDPSKFFADYIEFFTNKLEADFQKRGGGATKFFRTADGGFSQVNERPFTQYNRTANGVFSQSDSRNGLLNVYENVANGGTFSRQRTFADLNEKEKFDFVNKDNASLQARLSGAFDLATNRNALNDEQKASIDRKIISLSQGVTDKLTDKQRDLVATSLEKEAARRDAAERAAQASRDAHTQLLTRVAASNERLLEFAKKGGSEALIRLIDESGGAASVGLKKAPTAEKTKEFYFNQLDFQ